MLPLPEVDEDNKTVLWNHLPYCGLYNESPFQGKYANLQTPELKKVSVLGQPLPLINNGVNKNLRLIGFNNQTLEAPVTTIQPWRLSTYSPWIEYRVIWHTSSKCKIGFYTPNYLLDTDPFVSQRQTLLLGDNGPCIFEGTRGVFFFSNASEFSVIVDANVSIKLDIKCRAPCSIYFPILKLYKPLPYKLEDDCVFAYETKLNELSRDVSFVPTKKYIDLTEAMRQYLISLSVLIDFDPVLQSQRIIAVTPPKVFTGLRAYRLPGFPIIFYTLFPKDVGEGYGTVASPDGYLFELKFPVKTDTTEQYVRVDFDLLLEIDTDDTTDVWGAGFVRVGYIDNLPLVPYEESPTTQLSTIINKKLSTTSGSVTFYRTRSQFLLEFTFTEKNPSRLTSLISVKVTKLAISYLGTI